MIVHAACGTHVVRRLQRVLYCIVQNAWRRTFSSSIVKVMDSDSRRESAQTLRSLCLGN